MNTNLKNNSIIALLIAMFMLAPLCNANAQATEDEFGIWATVEASKKINKKFKVVGDVEFRTYDFVNNIERAAIGVKLEYKILKWLKSNVGYQFHYKHNPEETSIKDPVYDEEGNFAGNEYNIDNDYWVIRNRVYATISGEYKVGRFEFGLRERLQYTHTGSATTDETKYRYDLGMDPLLSTEDNKWLSTTEPEFKEAKHNLTLRSRLNVKYDIPNCKVNPFASVELYTRLDEWKGYDKLRYRLGASYKINKDNSISLYYLFEDVNGEANGHAIGFEYSIDL
jgi:hypothetical protein